MSEADARSVLGAKAREAAAIANCDREPIHTPGAIQPFGCLIAADMRLNRINAASANLEEFAGANVHDALGADPEELLGQDLAHEIRNRLGHTTIQQQRELVGQREFFEGQPPLKVAVHRRGDLALIEMQPMKDRNETGAAPLDSVRKLVRSDGRRRALEDLLEEAVAQIREMSGYDRVKAYRFMPDGSGMVVAEARAPEAPSYLGLRFPSFDIPPQARKLYVKTPIRVISDVRGVDAPIFATDAGAPPLDLSLAALRGVMPVHTEYLRNMGVGATFSLPIVVEGRLWGLFAAHHLSPKHPGPDEILALELAGQMLSMMIEHAMQTESNSMMRRATAVASKLVAVDDSELATSTYWQRSREAMAKIVKSDGIAYAIDGHLETFGSHPSRPVIETIRISARQQPEDALRIENLTEFLEEARAPNDTGEVAGALAIPLFEEPRIDLIYFRLEIAQTIKWAGAPEKDIDDDGPYGLRLSPRGSFAAFTEEVRGRCDSWTHEDLSVARALKVALAHAIDAQRDLKENRHRLGLMVRELNHRVRNILALIQSLSAQSRESAASLEDYASALETRITSLAGAHDLLTRSDMRGAAIEDLVRLELKPFLEDAAINEAVSGPPVALGADATTIAALLLHELTSNAVKYGALSVPEGTVSVTWERVDKGLALKWRERGGPMVSSPTREGFGRTIIESAIPYELGGEATMRFAPNGVECDFLLPATALNDGGVTASAVWPSEPAEAPEPEPATLRALVVEDNFVVAAEAARILRSLGFTDVRSVPSVGKAIALLETNWFDFCLLDVNLKGEMSAPVAAVLSEKGVPFALATGYGDVGRDLSEQSQSPILTKPVVEADIAATLASLGVDAPKMTDKGQGNVRNSDP